MADFVPVAKTSELPAGTKKMVFVGDKKIMIANAGGQYFAMDNACSHAGCSLAAEGMVTDGTITCGCHGSQFDLTTGAVVGPPAVVPMQVYKVKIEGDNVMVAV